jgi:predicted  nucleic acid-binding Zn-ribbon protein
MEDANLEKDQVNALIETVETRLESLQVDLVKLDELKDADAYRKLEKQIAALKDQQRLLSRRWRELIEGFLPEDGD